MQTPPLEAPLVAIVGAGPAGLAAAEVAAEGGARVIVFDRMASPARKFLLAGRGGLNLTHSEPFATFSSRYAEAEPRLASALTAFPPEALRRWSEELGVPTVVGTSGRVFPAPFKASPLLRAWLGRLQARGVTLALRHRWTGWAADGALDFETPAGPHRVHPRATVLALGGASWPRMGSDGAWVPVLEAGGLALAPLRPSNCGFRLDWPAPFINRFEGQPLKPLAITFQDKTVRGEVVVTREGLEGGAIYALSAALRQAIEREGQAVIHLALRPDLPAAALTERLARRPPKQSTATHLRKALALSPVAIGLVNAARHVTPEADLGRLVAALPLTLRATAPIERAISTAGGVRLEGIDEHGMVLARPGLFVAGEMLDWEAPTGGYLLQACFSTGRAAGRGVLAFLGLDPPA